MESRTSSGLGRNADFSSEIAFLRVFCDVGWKVVHGRGVRGEGKPFPAGSRYVRPKGRRILGSSGRPGTSFGRLFGRLGGILVVRQGAGNILQYCCAGRAARGGPKREITRSGDGKT